MDIQITQYTDQNSWLVQRGASRETFTTALAMRRYVDAWRAIRALNPTANLDLVTLANDGSILIWGLPGSPPTPAQLLAANTASDASLAQADVDALALRAQIVTVATSAVGVVITSLTANQVRALLAVLLWKGGALDKDGKVRPLAEWAQ